MLPIHLGLVSLTSQVSFGELSKVSAAIQKQLVRDFTPIWNIDVTIDAFATADDVPLGYWKLLVVDTFAQGGQHRDRKNQPYGLVAAGPSWSLYASHEALEMLADPFGNRLVAGDSPAPSQGRVEFLVEVCDPCLSGHCGYTVNGILVSDFYTPNYFDALPASGVRYSFTAAITAPRQVLDGGYPSWRVTSGDWFQQHRAGGVEQIKSLGQIAPLNASYRSAIDALTPDANLLSAKPLTDRATILRAHADEAATADAGQLLSLVAAVRDFSYEESSLPNAAAKILSGLINPKVAKCRFDLQVNVLCCSSCGGCGNHAHGNCSDSSGMKDPIVATCSLATCRLAGALCCSICGRCGKHPHLHF